MEAALTGQGNPANTSGANVPAYRPIFRLNCIGYDPEPFEARIEEGERIVAVERDAYGRGWWLTPEGGEAVLFDGEPSDWLVAEDEWLAAQEAA